MELQIDCRILATNSKPDITFAVNQRARFAIDHKRSHEKAVKTIARYLQGTSDRGIVIDLQDTLSPDLYADADFPGMITTEDKMDHINVESRTGWVLTLEGIPVTLKSKIQFEISISTTKVEYIALSDGMRELVETRRLIAKISKTIG